MIFRESGAEIEKIRIRERGGRHSPLLSATLIVYSLQAVIGSQ